MQIGTLSEKPASALTQELFARRKLEQELHVALPRCKKEMRKRSVTCPISEKQTSVSQRMKSESWKIPPS